MIILGISAYYHDSAAAIVKNGHVLYAAQEERFSRVKNDASFPENAIRFCLSEAGLTLDEVDYVAYYEKPFLKFERLLETYYAYAPKGFFSFVKAMPVWLKEKLFIKQVIKKRLKALGSVQRDVKICFPEHHLSHAGSAFYTSPFESCAFLTVDGVGEWTTTSYGVASRTEGIKVLGELHFPDSIGLFYSSFTYFLGFEVNSGEYKMMGLAPYATDASERVQRFIKVIKEKLVDIKPDGSIKLNPLYFEYAVGLRMLNPKKWKDLFGLEQRAPNDKLTQIHADLALAAQKVLEEVLIKMAAFIKHETGEKNLCLAGGVALNCVANSALFHQKIFDDIFVQPAAGDAGGALGAALAVAALYQKSGVNCEPKQFSPYLGIKFSEAEIERFLKTQKCTFDYCAKDDDLYQKVTQFIAAKKVVGWFQGRAEFGPRALGNRSIIADATDVDMQYKLNMKIKFREGFRPFAPAVCEEDYERYFEPEKQSYYMLFTNAVKHSIRQKLPADFDELTLDEKRKWPKSELPAVTHTDFSARVQVVTKALNPRFWQLIQTCKKCTGVGVLINTSFNVKDEPIVNSPADAYACFMKSGMDVLVLGNYIIEK